MRRPTISRKSAPAVIGSGLVVASVITGSWVAALSGGTHSVASAAGNAAARTGAGQPATGSGGSAAHGGATAAISLTLPEPTAVSAPPRPADNSKKPGGAGGSSGAGTSSGTTPPRLVVPDVIAAVPGGVTAADLAKLRRIGQVRAVLPVAGAKITVNGKTLTVLGAPQGALRAWMPPETAANSALWTAFARGDLITAKGAAAGLRAGIAYPATAAIQTNLTFGGGALLGVAGVDGVVNAAQAKRLGLASDVAVLINAPAANMPALTGQVRAALGAGSQVIRLVSVSASTKLPVDTHAPAGKPASYLSLYQASAARYCPGLSWTVLAAIGQIESADGTNDGPSSAGAL
ncbi:MAG TPA: hypothetical protein VG164_02470, partial [Trebonia sp.]|nr:hypothetical protein [Trebonia sp.]